MAGGGFVEEEEFQVATSAMENSSRYGCLVPVDAGPGGNEYLCIDVVIAPRIQLLEKFEGKRPATPPRTHIGRY